MTMKDFFQATGHRFSKLSVFLLFIFFLSIVVFEVVVVVV